MSRVLIKKTVIEYCHMTFQDRISVIVTFVVGLALGFYVYAAGFAPTYSLPEAVLQEEYGDLVIVADAYGACAEDNSCLSFQLLQDGTYRALLGPGGGRSFEGSISRSLRSTLQTTLASSTLATLALPLAIPTCQYGEAATNFSFLITRDGRNYTLDTCLSAIDYEGPSWQALRELFGVVAAESVK
jgi:hypothetical protein